MRYAVISDIHSNLEAFSAVCSEIDKQDIDEVICLGDVVGYNSNPNECVEIIRNSSIKCVMGNHDAKASGIEEPDDFTPLAREAILWTRRQLSNQSRVFLKSLARRILFPADKLLAVHGSVNSTDNYLFSLQDAADNFRFIHMETDVQFCFFGHTHVKIAYKETNGIIHPLFEDEIDVEDDTWYLINPGSVGQPRDGDQRAAFLIYDTDAEKVDFFRVAYDIDKCCEKIIKAGLPVELAERLSTGR